MNKVVKYDHLWAERPVNSTPVPRLALLCAVMSQVALRTSLPRLPSALETARASRDSCTLNHQRVHVCGEAEHFVSMVKRVTHVALLWTHDGESVSRSPVLWPTSRAAPGGANIKSEYRVLRVFQCESHSDRRVFQVCDLCQQATRPMTIMRDAFARKQPEGRKITFVTERMNRDSFGPTLTLRGNILKETIS